eukprot:CAMPEP_0194491070 /NCGR_PEP_ID=MMETSP0253-20130528/10078_1 /TAXON_ID=2966 /ORGANISM="Noctiluca scintillans" /LENGTH=74 /DNA_ID=CAMNT_0039331763 /DNA_START=11 /DNA_END=235 /DNA_ORIENTATION=-
MVSLNMMVQNDQIVTPALIAEHEQELEKCLAEVEESARKAKDAAEKAVATAEECRKIEDETKKMIALFKGESET